MDELFIAMLTGGVAWWLTYATWIRKLPRGWGDPRVPPPPPRRAQGPPEDKPATRPKPTRTPDTPPAPPRKRPQTRPQPTQTPEEQPDQSRAGELWPNLYPEETRPYPGPLLMDPADIPAAVARIKIEQEFDPILRRAADLIEREASDLIPGRPGEALKR